MLEITQLPSRYEPLVTKFGAEAAETTFVTADADLSRIKTLIARIRASGQSKLAFLHASSGQGKTTLVHSLPVFLADEIGAVVRLPSSTELSVAEIVAFVAAIERAQNGRITVVNMDGREAPAFVEAEYRGFLMELNTLMRSRSDLMLLWPVNDSHFADKVVTLIKQIAGLSPFGGKPILNVNGIENTAFPTVLERILKVGERDLADTGLGQEEIDALVPNCHNVGEFLDHVQQMIGERFDLASIGVNVPEIVFVVSSGKPDIGEVGRALRRANSFYVEASRLTMYTTKSNTAEWWANRSDDVQTALPYLIALFNAQLVTMRPSAVVHSVLNYGESDLAALVSGILPNKGNAKTIMRGSELYKHLAGTGVDNIGKKGSVKSETLDSYARIQVQSETRHKAINDAILRCYASASAQLDYSLETSLADGLITDAVLSGPRQICLEFHHKSEGESTPNKIAIYILAKLAEYAINLGLAQR